MCEKEKPYIIEKVVQLIKHYNPNYGDNRFCKCGHIYYRHFDSHENMYDVGCKYCFCDNFEEDLKDNCEDNVDWLYKENMNKRETLQSILNELDYDSGLMNSYGGGNVLWWHNYLRDEINHCNEHWRIIIKNYLEE